MKRKQQISAAPSVYLAALLGLQLAAPSACLAQPDPNWIDHDRTRPQPPVVTPATPSTQDQAGKAPSESVAREILETVRIYNAVPREMEALYPAMLLREYKAFCEKAHTP